MMAHVLQPFANTEQIFHAVWRSRAPLPQICLSRGAGPSPEPQNFLGHHSLVTESPVASCGDAASSAVPHASAASYHAEMGR